jgi:hypothetical protein
MYVKNDQLREILKKMVTACINVISEPLMDEPRKTIKILYRIYDLKYATTHIKAVWKY